MGTVKRVNRRDAQSAKKTKTEKVLMQSQSKIENRKSEMQTSVDLLQMHGPLRDSALARFAERLRGWGLQMPAVAPLVLDFGVDDFARTGLIEYWVANELEAGYCGKYLFVFDGQQCPAHSHAYKHETFFVVKGQVLLVVNGKDRRMNAGDVLAMPPGDVHSFTGLGDALLLECSTPCMPSDNIFVDPRVAAWHKRVLGAVSSAD